MKVEEYWEKYCKEKGVDSQRYYDSFSFGNTEKMADELAQLVVQGLKQGTSSGFDLYKVSNERVPQVGDMSIVLDGKGEPVCLIENTKVEVLPFERITTEHARLEGEGDLSLTYWQTEHIRFFIPLYQEEGITFTKRSLIVYEHFQLMYV